MSTALLGLGLFTVTANASDADGLERAMVATAVTAGAEVVFSVSGAVLGIVASPVIGDKSSGIGSQVGSAFVRGGTTGIVMGTVGGPFLAAFATETPSVPVGAVSAGVGLGGLLAAYELDRTGHESVTPIVVVGTMVTVPVLAGITAGFAKPRDDDGAPSLQASPTFGRDGGGVLLAGRF